MSVTRVPGRNAGHVKLYAISTCPWCKKARRLLDELGVAYDYEYIDYLDDAEQERAMQEVSVWNPSKSFPTIIINNKKCIVGYREDEIREALGE